MPHLLLPQPGSRGIMRPLLLQAPARFTKRTRAARRVHWCSDLHAAMVHVQVRGGGRLHAVALRVAAISSVVAVHGVGRRHVGLRLRILLAAPLLVAALKLKISIFMLEARPSDRLKPLCHPNTSSGGQRSKSVVRARARQTREAAAQQQCTGAVEARSALAATHHAGHTTAARCHSHSDTMYMPAHSASMVIQAVLQTRRPLPPALTATTTRATRRKAARKVVIQANLQIEQRPCSEAAQRQRWSAAAEVERMCEQHRHQAAAIARTVHVPCPYKC